MSLTDEQLDIAYQAERDGQGPAGVARLKTLPLIRAICGLPRRFTR